MKKKEKQKQKSKPDYYDPYRIDPPEECWICGQLIDDWRYSRRYMGHRCCRSCYLGKCE